MTTYAIVDDVATRLGRPITAEAEVAQVDAWLSDIEATILARIPDLRARVENGTIPLGTVVMVEANAVVRKALNPEGLRTRSTLQTIDDGTVQNTSTIDATQSDGLLRIFDEEWALLLPLQTRGAFTIRPRYSRRHP